MINNNILLLFILNTKQAVFILDLVHFRRSDHIKDYISMTASTATSVHCIVPIFLEDCYPVLGGESVK